MDFSLNNKNDYEIIINNNIINNFNNNKTNLFCNDKYFTKFQQFFLGLKSENNISNNLLKEINEIFENNKSNIELYEIFLSLFYVPNKKTNKDCDKQKSYVVKNGNFSEYATINCFTKFYHIYYGIYCLVYR